MKLIIDGDYNKDLITQIKKKALPITHYVVYIPNSSFGSGSILLPEELPSWEDFKEFLLILKDNNIIPIASLDTTCQGNLEAHIDQNNANITLLDELEKLGIQEYLISAPNNIRFIKHQKKNAKIYLSYSQLVTSMNRARIFFDVGADTIVLHPDTIRNMRSIKNFQKLPSKLNLDRLLDYILPLNLGCNWGCIQWYYHHNLQSHRTMNSPVLPNQARLSDVDNEFDYPLLYCWKKRLEKPSSILRSGWIAPQNIERYEKLGYKRFLLFTNGMSTNNIISMINSYVTKSLDKPFNEFLKIPHPYGDYWSVEKSKSALPLLESSFIKEFCDGFPYDESYPFEKEAEIYCNKYISKFEKENIQEKEQILQLIEEKLNNLYRGAIRR